MFNNTFNHIFNSVFYHIYQPYIVAGNILCVWAFNKKDVELKPSFANLLKFFSSSISTFIEINIIIIVIIIQMTFILNFYLL